MIRSGQEKLGQGRLDYAMSKKSNKRFETVQKAGLAYGGRFSSPYAESRGKTVSLTFPVSLDKWLENEAKKQGCTKTNLVREAVQFLFEQKTKDESEVNLRIKIGTEVFKEIEKIPDLEEKVQKKIIELLPQSELEEE